MGSKLRGIARKQQSDRAAFYSRTYEDLARTAVAWLEVYGDKPAAFSFRDKVAIFGTIAQLPKECLLDDGARELWEHCCAQCPDATILMFQALVEHIASVAADAGIGFHYTGPVGSA